MKYWVYNGCIRVVLAKNNNAHWCIVRREPWINLTKSGVFLTITQKLPLELLVPMFLLMTQILRYQQPKRLRLCQWGILLDAVRTLLAEKSRRYSNDTPWRGQGCPHKILFFLILRNRVFLRKRMLSGIHRCMSKLAQICHKSKFCVKDKKIKIFLNFIILAKAGI